MPTHGEERNRQLVTEYGENRKLVGPDGEVLYDGPLQSREYTSVERYCEGCEDWKANRTFVGHMICEDCHLSWGRLTAEDIATARARIAAKRLS